MRSVTSLPPTTVEAGAPTHGTVPMTPALIAATSEAMPDQANALVRARSFAEPLLSGETMTTGENMLAHADAVAAILYGIGGSETMQAAVYLVYASMHLNKPLEVLTKAFGANFATLAVETTKLMHVQQQARDLGLRLFDSISAGMRGKHTGTMEKIAKTPIQILSH